MAKISAELEQQLKAKPEQPVDLIVQAHGDVTPHLAWLASAGLEVKRQYKLSPGVAVCGRGADALKLLDQAWVKQIQLDTPVRAI
jgi:hypothetical protein